MKKNLILIIFVLSFTGIKAEIINEICGESPTEKYTNADSCEDAETYITLTPENIQESNNYFTVDESIEFATPNNTPGNCMMSDGPTVWFKIEIDSDIATKLVTQVTTMGFDVVWSVFSGTSCTDMIPAPEQLVINDTTRTYACSNSDNDPNNIFQTTILPMSASDSIYYWVAVTAISPITNPNFTLTYASALPVLACSGEDAFDCGNGDFEAFVDGEIVSQEDFRNFCPGETVEVCISFNYNTNGSSNDWFHGFVPVFGSGWDLEASDLASQDIGSNLEYFDADEGCGAYLNGYDLPNVCTYVEDGILKLCNEACNPGGCPCSGGMEAGDPLPSGWWYVSDGDTPSCGDECTPSDNYGWPSGTNVDVDICIDLTIKEFETDEELIGNHDLRVIIQTFSDAISGCKTDGNPCIMDPSFQGPSWEINTMLLPQLIITPISDSICSGEEFEIIISAANSSNNYEITIEAQDNPNIVGEFDSTVFGNDTIINTLTNLTNNTEIVSYIVTLIAPLSTNNNYIDTFDILVYAANGQIEFIVDSIQDITTEALGFIHLTTNNTGNYTFDWSGPEGFTADTEDLDSLINPGCYHLSILDSSVNCTKDTTICIVEGPLTSAEFILQNTSCFAVCDGMIELTNIFGGLEPYSYTWSNGQTTSKLIGLCAGEYGLTITDSYGYTIDTILSITQPSLLLANAEADLQSAIALPSGGTPAYNYLWSNGDTTQSVFNLLPGYYIVTVEDSNGCLATETVITNILFSIDSVFNITDEVLGAIYISSNIDNSGMFSWTGPNGFTSSEEDIIDLVNAGCYTVSISDTSFVFTQDTTICISDLTATTNIDKDYNINIYPNPTSNFTEIDFRKTTIQKAIISIFNINGALVSTILKGVEKDRISLDLKNQSIGLYFIKIDFDDKAIYKKLIKN